MSEDNLANWTSFALDQQGYGYAPQQGYGYGPQQG